MTIKEMIEHFSLDRVKRSNCKFDMEKLASVNACHMKATPDDKLRCYFDDYLISRRKSQPDVFGLKELSDQEAAVKADCLKICRGARNFYDVYLKTSPLFRRPDVAQPKDYNFVRILHNDLASIRDQDWNSTIIFNLIKKHGIKQAADELRLCLLGQQIAPPILEVMRVIGREETLRRLSISLSRMD